jgi:hypothetical protein
MFSETFGWKPIDCGSTSARQRQASQQTLPGPCECATTRFQLWSSSCRGPSFLLTVPITASINSSVNECSHPSTCAVVPTEQSGQRAAAGGSIGLSPSMVRERPIGSIGFRSFAAVVGGRSVANDVNRKSRPVHLSKDLNAAVLCNERRGIHIECPSDDAVCRNQPPPTVTRGGFLISMSGRGLSGFWPTCP